MNHTLLLRSLALIALVLPSWPTTAQEEPGTPTVLSLADIVLDQYPVQNVDAEELYELSSQLVGRAYFVKEHGGTSSSPQGNLRLLGDTIILYDTKEQVQRARELLGRLDAPRQSPGASDKIAEYRPRFISLETTREAVLQLVDLSVVRERGLVVLHDRADDIDAALAVLKRIDVPERQVLLTCQLFEVGSPQGPTLPKELLDNLQKLLPQTQFAQTGMAMLKTSVGGGARVSVQIDSNSESYLLSFDPVAFDEASGSLTIGSCSLIEAPSGKQQRELFRTNTVLRGGEYTVLAATGAKPLLLVVRVTPQG